jgi:hypothetical protein
MANLLDAPTSEPLREGHLRSILAIMPDAMAVTVKLQFLSAREGDVLDRLAKGLTNTDRLRSRNQSARGGNSSREPHGQAWREEPFERLRVAFAAQGSSSAT